MALVTVDCYRDPIDAELAITRLEQFGIPATLLDQHLASIYWLYSYAIGGVKLMVDETDLDAARQILRDTPSKDLPAETQDRELADAWLSCPDCRSSQIHASRLQRNLAAISLLLQLPLIAWRNRWVCEACGHTWKRESTLASDLPAETLVAEESVHDPKQYSFFHVVLALLLGLGALCYIEARIGQPLR